MTVRIMLDLETLGTENDAVIASVGAVAFFPELNTLGTTFYNVVDLDGQQAHGRILNAHTVRWWMGQSPEARALFLDDQKRWKPEDMLANFSDFLALAAGPPDKHGMLDVEMWGNGADFDNVILGDFYHAYSVKRPWSYARNRCFRTLKNLKISLSGGPNMPQNPVKHNALEDAKHQAAYANAYLRKLGGLAS